MSKAANAVTRTTQGKFRHRISAETRAAVEHMANTGASCTAAADHAKMTKDGLARALKKPHVKALLNQMIADVRENAAQLAYIRLNVMSQTAVSEHVKADTNKWIAGVDGISPVQKVQGQHHITHKFEGFDYDDPDVVDVTPPDTQSGGQDD